MREKVVIIVLLFALTVSFFLIVNGIEFKSDFFTQLVSIQPLNKNVVKYLGNNKSGLEVSEMVNKYSDPEATAYPKVEFYGDNNQLITNFDEIKSLIKYENKYNVYVSELHDELSTAKKVCIIPSSQELSNVKIVGTPEMYNKVPSVNISFAMGVVLFLLTILLAIVKFK